MTEPLRKIGIQEIGFSGLDRTDQGPNPRAILLPTPTGQVSEFGVIPFEKPNPESLQEYLTDKTPPALTTAIILIDGITSLTKFERNSLYAYFIWHHDSKGRFSKIKQAMNNGVALKDSQIDTYLDAVMDNEELGQIYETIESSISDARRVMDLNGGGNATRRLLATSQAVFNLRTANPIAEIDEDFIDAHNKRIDSLAENFLVRNAKIEFGIYDMGVEEMTRDNMRIREAISRLLQEGVTIEQTAKVVGLSRTTVGNIRDELGIKVNKQHPGKRNKTEPKETRAPKPKMSNDAKLEILAELFREQMEAGAAYVNVSTLILESGISQAEVSRLVLELKEKMDILPTGGIGRYGLKTIPRAIKDSISIKFSLLTDSERQVIEHRYGVRTKPLSPKEICHTLGITFTQESSLEHSALTKLRAAGVNI